ncbi:MAG: hypothetical protein ACFCUU_00650 [Cyclobacteriaceae bacterium]
MSYNRKFNIVLLNLYCYAVEESGFDDVFLKFNKKKIWPVDKCQIPVRESTITPLDVEIVSIEPGENIEVEVWDFDYLSPNDLLGTFHIKADAGGPYSTDMIQNTAETTKAKYTLEWEVI